MQRMPAKTKTLVAAGAALIAVIIGVFAIMSNRNTDAAPLTNDPAASLDQNDPSTDAVADTDTDTETTTPVGSGSLTPSTDTDANATIPTTHKVEMGDTLYSISRKYYNDDPLYADDIAELNPELTDPDFLTVGMDLKLPPLAPAMTDTSGTDSSSDAATDSDKDTATDNEDATDSSSIDMDQEQTAQ